MKAGTRTEPLDAVEALDLAAAAFAGAGPEAKLYLYRVEPKAPGMREDGYLRTYGSPPELDEIREEFGGSTFRIRLRTAGRWTEHNFVFSIEGKPRFVDNTSTNGAADDRLARLERIVEQLATSRGASSEDEDARADRREFHRTLRQAMITREFGKAMNAAEHNGKPDPFEMVERVLDMVDQRASDEGPMMDAGPLAAFAPLLAKLLDGKPAPPKPRPAPARLPGSRAVPQSPEDRLLRELARATDRRVPPDQLVAQARRGLPPALVEQLAGMSAEDWTGFVQGQAARFPAFGKPGALAYLATVHEALTKPPKTKKARPTKPGPPPSP